MRVLLPIREESKVSTTIPPKASRLGTSTATKVATTMSGTASSKRGSNGKLPTRPSATARAETRVEPTDPAPAARILTRSNDVAIWIRVLQRRTEEWQTIIKAAVEYEKQDLRDSAPAIRWCRLKEWMKEHQVPVSNWTNPPISSCQVQDWMQEKLEVCLCSNATSPPERRRAAWTLLQTFLNHVDAVHADAVTIKQQLIVPGNSITAPKMKKMKKKQAVGDHPLLEPTQRAMEGVNLSSKETFRDPAMTNQRRPFDDTTFTQPNQVSAVAAASAPRHRQQEQASRTTTAGSCNGTFPLPATTASRKNQPQLTAKRNSTSSVSRTNKKTSDSTAPTAGVKPVHPQFSKYGVTADTGRVGSEQSKKRTSAATGVNTEVPDPLRPKKKQKTTSPAPTNKTTTTSTATTNPTTTNKEGGMVHPLFRNLAQGSTTSVPNNKRKITDSGSNSSAVPATPVAHPLFTKVASASSGNDKTAALISGNSSADSNGSNSNPTSQKRATASPPAVATATSTTTSTSTNGGPESVHPLFSKQQIAAAKLVRETMTARSVTPSLGTTTTAPRNSNPSSKSTPSATSITGNNVTTTGRSSEGRPSLGVLANASANTAEQAASVSNATAAATFTHPLYAKAASSKTGKTATSTHPALPTSPPPAYERHSETTLSRNNSKKKNTASTSSTGEFVHPIFQNTSRQLMTQAHRSTTATTTTNGTTKSSGSASAEKFSTSTNKDSFVHPVFGMTSNNKKNRMESSNGQSSANNANTRRDPGQPPAAVTFPSVNDHDDMDISSDSDGSVFGSKSASSKKNSLSSQSHSKTSTASVQRITNDPKSKGPQNMLQRKSLAKRKNDTPTANPTGASTANGAPLARTTLNTISTNGLPAGNRDVTPIENKPPPIKITVSNHVEHVSILADDGEGASMHSRSQQRRASVKIAFKKQNPSYDMVKYMASRLRIWEPFWEVEGVVKCGMTSPVESVVWTSSKGAAGQQPPSQVASFEIADLSKVKKYQSLSTTLSEPEVKHGNFQLQLRMLPISRNKYMEKKRSDGHLWPIGTFLSLQGKTRLVLRQRAQSGHDHNEWKGICHYLDLGPHISWKTKKIQIDLCTYDTEAYYYCLAVCRYVSPEHLSRSLEEPQNSILPKRTLEESMNKALEKVQQSSIIVDDDDDGGGSKEEVGKFIFSLVCPISKVPMQYPVRGRKCKHFQCFDLRTFMKCNKSASGMRWKCTSCESFLSYQDLEHCALTQTALAKYTDEASSERDRIEFKGDKTYSLLPPQKLRYASRNAKAKRNTGGSDGPRPPKKQDAEVVELIDSD